MSYVIDNIVSAICQMTTIFYLTLDSAKEEAANKRNYFQIYTLQPE